MLGWSVGNDSGQGKAIAGLAKLKATRVIAADSTAESVPVEHIVFDRGNFFKNDGKVYAPQDGVYLIIGQVSYSVESTALGSRWVELRKNGTEWIAQSNSSPNSSTAGVSAVASVIVELKKDDYIELFTDIGSMISAPNTTMELVADLTQLSIARLGD